MELEVGMYVRTKQGYIAKFKEYDEIFDMLRFETPIFLRSWMPCDYMQKERFVNRYFLKASHNIIDLIEVGDYVNGSKVVDISIIGKDKEKWVWVEQMEDTDNKYGDDYVGYNNEQIKSIVTKEQFEAMEYKVESEVK